MSQSNGGGFLGLDPMALANQQAMSQMQQTQLGQSSVVLDEAARRRERAEDFRQKCLPHISPLHQPPIRMPHLLNERRERYLIVDQMFQFPASYDRILVHQVSMHHDTDTAGGLIVLTEKAKEAQRDGACLGIIVSAGLLALDEMASNGHHVGDLVAFVQWSVYRLPTTHIAGHEFPLLVLKSGDIVANCDLQRRINEQSVRIVPREVKDPSTGDITIQHVYVDEHGKMWRPQEPFTSEI